MSDVATPILPVRTAFFNRLAAHAATSGYTLKREGVKAEMPFIHVGSAYKGAGGTDPLVGVNVVQTITAFAWSDEEGAETVSKMIEAVFAAVFSADFEIGSLYFEVDSLITEDDQLAPDLVDEQTGREYAQRLVRYRANVLS